MTTLENLLEFKKEITALYEAGKTLREISKYSYEQRESGRNIPYLAITDKGAVPGGIIRITAQPVVKQKELYEFFRKDAKDSVLPEYQLYVDIQEGVVFTHKFGKGKENFELL